MPYYTPSDDPQGMPEQMVQRPQPEKQPNYWAIAGLVLSMVMPMANVWGSSQAIETSSTGTTTGNAAAMSALPVVACSASLLALILGVIGFIYARKHYGRPDWLSIGVVALSFCEIIVLFMALYVMSP